MTSVNRRLVAAMATLSLAVVAACGGGGGDAATTTSGAGATTSTTAPRVDTLRFAVVTDERNLSPFTYSTGYPGASMSTLVFDTLLWPDPDGVPQPWLATSAEVSADGLTWTVRIEPGVTFHDGEALTSADVKFTFEYLQQHPRPAFTPPLQPITAIETPDDQTVVITLEEPRASFRDAPLANVPIMPEHIWSTIDAPAEVTDRIMVGSGPYRMVEYEPEEVWRFEANEGYFKGTPVVDELVMPYLADAQAAFTALQGGQVDAVAPSLTPELEDQFNQGGLETAGGPGFRGWYLYMNNGRAPFDQPGFRQAVAAAVDMEDIVATLLLGAGVAGSPGFVHRAAPWSNPATREHTHDPAEARSLLDDLGFDDGNGDGVREDGAGTPLRFNLLVPTNDAIAPRAAELISEDLAAVGIAFNVVGVDASTASNAIWPDYPVGRFLGDYTVGLHSWAGTVQLAPDFLTNLFHSDPAVGTLNRAAYQNPDYDERAQAQASEMDPDERERLLYELQEILAEDVPALPLYYADEIFPYRPAAFDRWVHHRGSGILDKTAFLP